MQLRCEICGHAEGHRFHTAREMMVGWRVPFQYLECAGCGCLQNVSVPDDLGRYYADGYYSMAGRVRPDPAWRRALKARRTRAFLGDAGWLGAALLRRFGPPGLPAWACRAGVRQHHRLLEVGCGAGDLLLNLQSEGYTQLSGADPFIPADIDHGGGLHIRQRAVAELQGQWDAVVLEHAFEHIPDPHATLRHLAGLVAPGGALILSLPLKAEAWDLYGVDWVQLDAPRHLYLHTERSLGHLVAESGAGLQIEDVDFDSGAVQFWGSEQYRADIPLLDERSHRRNPQASRFSPADIAAFERRAQALNAQRRGDQATFVLRRPR